MAVKDKEPGGSGSENPAFDSADSSQASQRLPDTSLATQASTQPSYSATGFTKKPSDQGMIILQITVFGKQPIKFVISCALYGREAEEVKYILYTRRWFVLAVISVLNTANAMLWISYAPVANFTDEFYGKGSADLLSLVFMIASIPVGFAAMWSVDKFGLRSGILMGSWATCLGAVIRIISSLPPLPDYARFGVAMFGQCVAACAQPFIMYLPPKLAALWFPEDQRATANTIGSMANPLGILLAMVISPQIVTGTEKILLMDKYSELETAFGARITFYKGFDGVKFFEKQGLLKRNEHSPLELLILDDQDEAVLADKRNLTIFTQYLHHLKNGVFTIPAALVAVTASFGICSSLPPTPPTFSAGESSPPFFEGLKMAVKVKAFWVLLICLGGGMGLFNAIYTLIQQILCPKGYENTFVGVCGALLIVGGLIGAGIAGLVVDKTKKFQLVAKLSYAGAAIFACVFTVVSLRVGLGPAIAISCFLFGAMGFGLYPIGLELGVECTYPVAEATSAGLIIISGQLQGIILVLLMNLLAGDPSVKDTTTEKCTQGNLTDVKPQDWTIPNIVWCSGATLFAVCFTLFFWPKLKRREAEQMSLRENLPTVSGSVSA